MNGPIPNLPSKEDEVLAEIESVLNVNVPVATTLPDGVNRFTAQVEENFERTAINLDTVAGRLEMAAQELRSRAKDLRDASPDVRNHIERWIQFERESSERSKFLNTLFMNKIK